jgi:type VI secretion system protein ImpC
VDLDSFDEVFARVAPAVALPSGPGIASATLEIRCLDDFHPDRLFERIASFASLRDLRERLLDPATFKAAAAQMGARGRGTSELDRSMPTDGAIPAIVTDESAAGTLERLLGNAPSVGMAASLGLDRAVDTLIREAVAPHIVPDVAAMQSTHVATVDAELAAQMRHVLHDESFSALESAWRGVQWLVTRLDLGEELQLHILDVTRDELQADLNAARSNLADSGLHRALCPEGMNIGPGWALLAGLFSVGLSADDLDLVAALGAVASSVGGPVVLAASPSLLGCDGAAKLADPRTWRPLEPDAAAHWLALRQSAVAPWIGLVAPRVLMRLPYGKRTDATERFAFEEQPAEPIHETLLWGPGSLAVALLLGRAFGDGGWEAAGNPGSHIDQLPAYSFERDGEMQRQPCAEVWLDEPAVDALVAYGVMPLASDRRSAAVRLLRSQSITLANLPLAGSRVGPS